MHSFDTAQSLLALPAEETRPSPYRVFGLAAGESDAAAIAQAIQSTIARLNAAKPNADPTAWQQAAVWVKQARGVLSDPVQKAQLDQVAAQPAHDPLSGLLPGSDGASAAPATEPVRFRAGSARVLPPSGPLATHSPAPPATAPTEPPAVDPFGISPPLPPSLSAQRATTPTPSPETLLAATGPAVDVAALPIQVAKPEGSKGRRRRKRFPWAAVSLGVLTLVSIGGIAGLIYVLNRNPGGITINLQAGTPDGGEPAVSDRSPAPERPAVDPVMGGLAPAPARQPRRERDNAEQLAAADNWLASLGNRDAEQLGASAEMAQPADVGAQSEQMMTSPSAETAMDLPADSLSAAEPTMEMAPASSAGGAPLPTAIPAGDAEAANQVIDKARQAIAAADWQTMQPLAEAAVQAAVTAEQTKQASQLLQLAELASYYHGGIERGLDGLAAGESFAITEQIQVVIVEIGPEVVVVKFSGRNKDYPRHKLPLVLAHKIATFAMPADAPETAAAAQAYQAVAPISTPQYRQQAIRALEAMTEPVEGAEPVDVAAAIRDVFAE